MTDVAKAAYLAGLMDGEGCFSIQVALRDGKNRKSLWLNPRTSMSLTYGRDVLKELVEVFGGKIYHYAKDDKWDLAGIQNTKIVAETLLPYLRIKKKIAERFLEALSLFPDKRASHLTGERSWSLEKALTVAEIALTLNKAGDKNRKLSKDKVLESIKEMYQASPGDIIRDHNKIYEVNGKALTVAEWSRELGISIQGIRSRLHRDWPLDKVFTSKQTS